jgi:predicted Zn-dependent protease
MSGSRIVQLIPLGPVPETIVTAAATVVREHFGCQPLILGTMAVPPAARRPERAQVDADSVLDALFDHVSPEVCRVVGITVEDAFAQSRNFVFGYAHMRDRVCLVSVARLVRMEHLEKAVVHELGHTFHAPHCVEARCVMRQVEHLWQLDGLDSRYCDRCAARVAAVAARDPDDAENFFELAGSCMRRRRHLRAVAAYRAASERDPSNPHYLNDLGVAYLAAGERPAASRAFQRVIDLAPGFPHAYYNLGILFRERGDVLTADALFGAAIERDVDACQAHRYLGILHQDYFQDSPRARAHLERYVALGGADLDVRRRLRLLSRRAMSELASQSRRLIESTAPV